jgi:hypothetical protein
MNSFLDGVKLFVDDVADAIQDRTPMSVAQLQALGQMPPVVSPETWINIHYELIKEHAYHRARRGLLTLNFPLEVSKERPAAYIKKGTCAVADIIPIVELLKKKFPGTKIWTDTYQEDTSTLIVINMDWSG